MFGFRGRIRGTRSLAPGPRWGLCPSPPLYVRAYGPKLWLSIRQCFVKTRFIVKCKPIYCAAQTLSAIHMIIISSINLICYKNIIKRRCHWLLRSSNTNLLTIPFAHIALAARSFSVVFPEISNSLPPASRALVTVPASQDSLLPAILFIPLVISLLAPQIRHLLTSRAFTNFIYLLTCLH